MKPEKLLKMILENKKGDDNPSTCDFCGSEESVKGKNHEIDGRIITFYICHECRISFDEI